MGLWGLYTSCIQANGFYGLYRLKVNIGSCKGYWGYIS